MHERHGTLIRRRPLASLQQIEMAARRQTNTSHEKLGKIYSEYLHRDENAI